MTTYIMNVYCARGGVGRDSGTHFTRDYSTDAEAINAAQVEVVWLSRHYDEIEWELITTEGRRVK